MAAERTRRGRLCAAVAAALLGMVLAACVSYHAAPLPRSDDLASQAPTPRLDMERVAAIAVLNNPDLNAARASQRVAQAQAFAAGLLPDPQLSWSLDHPTDHITDPADPRYPEFNAYSLGLSIDLQALLRHGSEQRAASAALQQSRLDLLWQEWQTVARARALYVEQSIAAERRQLLSSAAEFYGGQAQRSQRALERHDSVLDQTGSDAALFSDARTQLGSAERARLDAEQALHALLGLKPEVTLSLAPLQSPQLPSEAGVRSALERLPDTRPDLQALQHGYDSQEALLRNAVLAQFPNLSLDLTHARDTSNVHSNGVGITLSLPLFDRGRGQIAIEQATRAQLRAEYQARLDQATADAWQLWQRLAQQQRELSELQQRLPALGAALDRARSAYTNGDLGVTAYLGVLAAYVGAHGSELDLRQSSWSDAIALATVLGTQLEPALSPKGSS